MDPSVKDGLSQELERLRQAGFVDCDSAVLITGSKGSGVICVNYYGEDGRGLMKRITEAYSTPEDLVTVATGRTREEAIGIAEALSKMDEAGEA
jgi:hypothetical protein